MCDFKTNKYNIEGEKDAYVISVSICTVVYTDIKEIKDLNDLTGDLRYQIAHKLQEGSDDLIELTLREWQKVDGRFWKFEAKNIGKPKEEKWVKK